MSEQNKASSDNEFKPDWDVSKEVLAELQEENAQLKQTIKEQTARVARLEKALDYSGVKLIEHKDHRAYGYVDRILCEEGPQSLAAIQADAVEDLLPKPMSKTTVPVACREPLDYAMGYNRCINEIKRDAQSLRDKA